MGLRPFRNISIHTVQGSSIVVRIKFDPRTVRVNPLDPSLLGITASPTEPPGAVDPIGDIIIDHISPFKGSTQLF